MKLRPDSSKSPYINFNIGMAKGETNDYKGAIKYISKAIKQYPEEGAFFRQRAYWKLRKKELKGVLDDINNAEKLGYSKEFIYDIKGGYYYLEKNFITAKNYYLKALKYNPKEHSHLIGVAYSDYKLGNIKVS